MVDQVQGLERSASPRLADAVVLRHPDIDKPYVCSARSVPHWERRGWIVQTGEAPEVDPASEELPTAPETARAPGAAPETSPVDEPANTLPAARRGRGTTGTES